MKDTDKIRRLTVEERKIWVEVSRELRELERRAADLTQNLEEAAAVGELEPITRVRGAVRGGFPTGLTAVRGQSGPYGRDGRGLSMLSMVSTKPTPSTGFSSRRTPARLLAEGYLFACETLLHQLQNRAAHPR